MNFIARLLLQLRLVQVDPILHAHFAHQFADERIGDLIDLFKADAAFAHVQLLGTVLRILIHKPVEQRLIGVEAHVVEVDGAFGGSDACERQRLAGLAVIAAWIETVRHHVA